MTDRHQFILAALILMGTLVYGVWQWNERSALNIEATSLQSQVTNLSEESAQLASAYQSIKKDVQAARATAAQELNQVFPTQESLSELTRLLDSFAVKNNFANNPFFVSNVNYQNSVAPEGTLYQYVPVSMEVSTSKKNLSKFLEYVETSGSLEGEVRLMSVQELSVNYPNEYGGVFEARIQLNAYFAQAL